MHTLPSVPTLRPGRASGLRTRLSLRMLRRWVGSSTQAAAVALLTVSTLSIGACSSNGATRRDASSDAPNYDAEPVDGSACGAVIQQHPIEGFTHVPVCSPVSYGTNPPSSGNHYPIWAAYREYSTPVPPGFWVHDLEHGAVVITYNCPSGCAADLAKARAFIAALPVDPLCSQSGGPQRRIVMTPDPSLDVEFAASSWGWTLKASCFESAVFAQFVAAHYGHGREVTCADGYDLEAPDGGLTLPAGCADAGLDAF